MASKMAPNKQFMETKVEFLSSQFASWKGMGQCNPTIDPNVYHYYVVIEQFKDL